LGLGQVVKQVQRRQRCEDRVNEWRWIAGGSHQWLLKDFSKQVLYKCAFIPPILISKRFPGTWSQSGTSIKKTLIQVLSGLGRNASTLMPSWYYFITHSGLPRFPSSPPRKYHIKYHILFKSRDVNERIKKVAYPQQFGANY